MSSQTSIRRWYAVHKWTSLVCTAFMLLLCLTGLPLIFHHEIEELTEDHHEMVLPPEGTPRASLAALIDSARARFPGTQPQFIGWSEEDHPGVVLLGMAPRGDSPEKDFHFVEMNAFTADILKSSFSETGFMTVMFRLHVDLFAGLPGKLFLGLMGILLVVAIISGAVVYGPFMRKLEFGEVRPQQRRLKWLDLHNLLGIVTLCWLLVVGGTGVINTWADLLIKLWQFNEVNTLLVDYKDRPEPTQLTGIDEALATAQAQVPEMKPRYVFYPRYFVVDNRHHYIMLFYGNTPVTSRLLTPVLVDAQTGDFTTEVRQPWYIKTLLLSQPLHFGDYAGLPLKILWGLLDIISIIVLGSGLYLWFARRKLQDERIRRLTEKAAGTGKTEGAQP